MTWFVKARDADGTVHPILCDEPKQVAENFEDQRGRGRTVWIEDAVGKNVDPSSFGIKQANLYSVTVSRINEGMNQQPFETWEAHTITVSADGSLSVQGVS